MTRQKIKNGLALVLAIVMLLSLAACAGTTTSSTASKTESTPSATESKEEATYYNKTGLPICNDEITLTMVSISDYTKDWNKTWFMKWVRENMGINIDTTVYPQETIKSQYALLLTNDDLPDLCWFNNLTSKEIDDGYVLSFDQYMEDGLMPNLTAFFEKYPEAKRMATYDGKVYKLGNVRTDPISCTVRFQVINTRWLENVGMEMPETVDDLYQVLKAFKEKDANGNGDPNDEIPLSYTLDTSRIGERGDWNMLGSFGIDTTSQEYLLQAKDGKVYLAETTDNYKAYLSYLSKLFKEGLLDNELYTQSDDEYKEKMKNDRLGVSGSWLGLGAYTLTDTDEEVVAAAKEYVWTPAFKSDYNDDTNVVLWNYANPGSCIASAKTKYPEAIARFVDYWYTEEGAILYNYGIEGETFDYKESECGLKSFDYDAYYEKQGYTAENKGDYMTQYVRPSNFVTWFQYSPANYAIAQVTDEAELANYKNYKASANAAIIQEGLLKYGTCAAYPNVSYTSDQESAISEKKAAIQSLIKTYKCQFITGILDVDAEWDNFQNELKKAGLDDVMKVEQEAYDNYMGE